MSRAYPFRFYGADPSEWEGEVFSYEVRFHDAPGDAARAAIATAFESALVGGSVTARDHAIRWAGAWVLLTVELRARSTDVDYGLVFGDVRDALEAVHRVAAIDEAVFLELLDRSPEGAESGGEWHRWSVAKQPIPSDAPNWSWGRDGLLPTLFAAKQTRFAATPTVDPAVEAARRQVWDAAARAAEATAQGAIADARVVFEKMLDGPTKPKFIAGSGRDAWRRGPGSYCDTRAPTGSWLYAHRDGSEFEVFLGDEKKLDPIAPKVRGSDLRWAYGNGSVFVWDGSAIHEVDLASRTARQRIVVDAPVEAMAVLGGSLVVITGELTAQQLVVHELGETPRERLRIPCAGKTRLDALLGGTVLAIHAGVVWGDRTLLVAYREGGFHVMGASHECLGLVWDDGGLVVAELEDEYETYVAIQNLEAAREAALRRAPEAPLDLAASEGVYGSVPELDIELVDVDY